MRTLTGVIGKRKIIVIEAAELQGNNFGLLRKGGIPQLRVSPSVYKLMQDDFMNIAKILKVKTVSGEESHAGDLPELSDSNRHKPRLPKMRRAISNRLYRKSKTTSAPKISTAYNPRSVPPPASST